MLSHELDDLFQTTRLKVHEGTFMLLGLSSEDGIRMMSELEAQRRTTRPFMSFQDGFECTFLFREEDRKAAGIFLLEQRVESGFRLVTLDRELNWDVVGYLARVTRLLADANISVGVLSSFSRDHLLIKETDLELALLILDEAITGPGEGGNDVN
jgi:hypothetical protein